MADPRASVYDVGDVAQLTITVRDTTGTLVDALPTVRYLRPGDTFPTTVNPTQTVDAAGAPVTGTYTATISLDTPGTWALDAKTTGAYQAAAPASIRVRTPKIA